MPESTKFLQLLTALRDATAHGRVRWLDTADDSMFRTTIGNGMVRIDKRFIPEEEEGVPARPYYVAWLLNEDGNIADQIEAYGGNALSVLGELYDLARRSARKADKLLDSMLKELTEGRAGKA